MCPKNGKCKIKVNNSLSNIDFLVNIKDDQSWLLSIYCFDIVIEILCDALIESWLLGLYLKIKYKKNKKKTAFVYSVVTWQIAKSNKITLENPTRALHGYGTKATQYSNKIKKTKQCRVCTVKYLTSITLVFLIKILNKYDIKGHKTVRK